MIAEGQIVLFRFPQADQTLGKLRPALVLRQVSALYYDDWLVCMISTQLSQAIVGFDEALEKNDSDFARSGLKMPSVIRIGRLAVVDRHVLLGRIGSIDAERLLRIRQRLARCTGRGLSIRFWHGSKADKPLLFLLPIFA